MTAASAVLTGVVRHLRAGLSFAVVLVNSLILRKNACQLEAVLVYLFHDAGVQNPVRRTVDDQLRFAGFQVHLSDHLGDAAHGLNAAAGAVGNEEHGVDVRKRPAADMLQTSLVVYHHVAVIADVFVDLCF